jgi:hypothetical protein
MIIVIVAVRYNIMHTYKNALLAGGKKVTYIQFCLGVTVLLRGKIVFE